MASSRTSRHGVPHLASAFEGGDLSVHVGSDAIHDFCSVLHIPSGTACPHLSAFEVATPGRPCRQRRDPRPSAASSTYLRHGVPAFGERVRGVSTLSVHVIATRSTAFCSVLVLSGTAPAFASAFEVLATPERPCRQRRDPRPSQHPPRPGAACPHLQAFEVATP